MAETVGSLVDKLSITQLKLYHMLEQTTRSDIDPFFLASCQGKVARITAQRDALRVELSTLMRDVLNGTTRLQVFRQFKMYNDPQYRSNDVRTT